MLWLNSITDAAKQNLTTTTEDGYQVSLYLWFSARQNCWFVDVACPAQNFTAQGLRLSLSPNFLRQFRNNITFGMTVVSSDGIDPDAIDDFLTGRVQVYTLNATDVQTIENEIYPTTSEFA